MLLKMIKSTDKGPKKGGRVQINGTNFSLYDKACLSVSIQEPNSPPSTLLRVYSTTLNNLMETPPPYTINFNGINIVKTWGDSRSFTLCYLWTTNIFVVLASYRKRNYIERGGELKLPWVYGSTLEVTRILRDMGILPSKFFELVNEM